MLVGLGNNPQWQTVEKELTSIQGVPKPFVSIIKKALSPEPKNRYRDAAEMLNALLDPTADDTFQLMPSPEWMADLLRPLKRYGAALLLLLGLVIALMPNFWSIVPFYSPLVVGLGVCFFGVGFLWSLKPDLARPVYDRIRKLYTRLYYGSGPISASQGRSNPINNPTQTYDPETGPIPQSTATEESAVRPKTTPFSKYPLFGSMIALILVIILGVVLFIMQQRDEVIGPPTATASVSTRTEEPSVQVTSSPSATLTPTQNLATVETLTSTPKVSPTATLTPTLTPTPNLRRTNPPDLARLEMTDPSPSGEFGLSQKEVIISFSTPGGCADFQGDWLPEPRHGYPGPGNEYTFKATLTPDQQKELAASCDPDGDGILTLKIGSLCKENMGCKDERRKIIICAYNTVTEERAGEIGCEATTN